MPTTPARRPGSAPATAFLASAVVLALAAVGVRLTIGSGTDGTPSKSKSTRTAATTTAPAGGKAASADLTPEAAYALVSSAENASTDWKSQYDHIEDTEDGHVYRGGVIGFSSDSGGMFQVVQLYQTLAPGNVLAGYVQALAAVENSGSHKGLDKGFAADWSKAAKDPQFQTAQNEVRDHMYFDPAVAQAKADGLQALGQLIYFDAMVDDGSGMDPGGFAALRTAAMQAAKTPAQGGKEADYLKAFLKVRKTAMQDDASNPDTSRIDTEQQAFLDSRNFTLKAPLAWQIKGVKYAFGG